MFRKSSLLIAAFAIVLAAPVAHGASAKSFMINVHGGAGLPMGDFKDENALGAKTGWQFGGGVDYMLTDQLAIGVDGSYGKNKYALEGEPLDAGGGETWTYDPDKFTTRQLGAHAKWMFPTQSPVSPYALIGLGAYNIKENWTRTIMSGGTVTAVEEGIFGTRTRFGGKLGFGATYKATEMVGIGIEGDYNFVSTDKATTGSSSLQYIGLHAGVSFNVMPK